MFEGNPPRPGNARPLPNRDWDRDALRPLNWRDLVARLSAVRDLRSGGVAAEYGCDASFDAGSARRIAAHHNGKQAVNPDNSSNGKGPEGTAGGVHGVRSGAPRN